MALRESMRRGWTTYTDIDVLAQSQLLSGTWDLIASHVVGVALACTATYLASLFTLVGSALVVSSLPWNTVPDCTSAAITAPPHTQLIDYAATGIATTGHQTLDTEQHRFDEAVIRLFTGDDSHNLELDNITTARNFPTADGSRGYPAQPDKFPLVTQVPRWRCPGRDPPTATLQIFLDNCSRSYS